MFFVARVFFSGAITDFILHAKINGTIGGGEAFPSFQFSYSVEWLIRLTLLVVFVIAAYMLAEFTLRPMRVAHLQQRRFIANVSHELRTPLSILKTNAEVTLLKGEKLTKEEAVEVIKGNIEEVDRLAAIVQFFLHFSMLQDRDKRLQMSLVNLPTLARKVLSIIQWRAMEKGITIDVTDTGEIGPVWGNATALEELLLNLAKNAVAYTPEGGTIEIVLRSDFNEVLLAVRDNGIGISATDLPHIFEPFYKGANGAYKPTGVGLGLAIVREIAHMHHATIGVKSDAGKGTTFTLHFPRASS
jgi:two-component system phosphate regulon sensor histidine kinase PhoR